MNAADAEMYARDDVKAIIHDANQLSLDLAPGERRIIVDGSMYAPSWRALTGGGRVWDEAASLVGVVDAYTETLDRLLDDWSSPNGGHLSWDEGMLFLGIAEDEHVTTFGTLTPHGLTNVRTLKQSDMLACPHVIMVPEHYRDDGTCRCDDPDHAEMAEWGYTWRAGRWQ